VYIHILEYYSALKRKEILTDAINWMNLEDMLSEISQYRRANTIGFHLHELSKLVKFTETESRMVVANG
jgi:hypothetical protein